MVSHELPSLFDICDDGVFLDAGKKTAIAHGAPRELRDHSSDPAVLAFMTRAIPNVPTPAPTGDAHGPR
jgi:phospholipid/cholesterol/gamma-HCH transport system ATP-binding protein